MVERDVLGAYGKTAALLFDEIVMQTPHKDMIRSALSTAEARGMIAADVASELRKIWRPIQGVLPDYSFLGENPWKYQETDVVSAAERITTEEVARDATPETPRGAIDREIRWAGAGLIEAVKVWSALQAKTETPCAFLADATEGRLLREVFGEAHPSDGADLFCEIAKVGIPNFSAVPWDRIMELRHNPFLDSFRAKMRELQNTFVPPKDVAKAVRELELESLRELARSVEPRPGRTILKAVVGNAPSPLLLNPFSIGSSIRDVTSEFVRTQRFGWLYFLMDLQDASGA